MVIPYGIDCIVVVLTGITGAGKSSTCSFLLGKEKVRLERKAVTSQSGSYNTVLNDRAVEIIDCYSFHEDSENDENIRELHNVISLARNQIHAIALVVNRSQFTSSHMTLLLELLREYWPFVFIIFSAAKGYGDTNEEQRKKIKTHDSLECPDFKKLLDKVQGRFIMLESTETNQDYRTLKLTEFLKMIDNIYHTNERNKNNPAEEQGAEIPYQEDEVQHASEESEKGQELKETTAYPLYGYDCGVW